MQNTIISKFLNKSIDYLHERIWLTAILTFLYAYALMAMHDPLVNVSIKVMKSMGLDNYNIFISSLSLAALMIFSLLVVHEFLKNKGHKVIKFTYFIVIAVALVLHYFYLLEMNIEIIHAFAYAPLVFLMYSIFRRHAAAIIFTLPIMLIDEYYQYQILYEYVEYWELNDVLLDILGGIALLSLMLIANVKLAPKKLTLTKRPEFYFLIIMMSFFVIATLANVFSIHQIYSGENTIFEMSRLQQIDSGWYIHSYTKAHYYVLNPLQSFFIFSGISIALLFFDSCLQKLDY